MADERPVNLEKPAITVHYLNLVRAQDDVVRSQCPFCADGALLMVRHQVTGKLIAHDRCISCGQAVVYADLDAAFPATDSDEREEMRFNRQAGIPCRVCGHDCTPIYQGNTLIGFYCPRCKEDFMP